jgi:hypothetical protein
MQDVGNPFHTPMAQIIPLQFIDDPQFLNIGMNYEALHNAYEDLVTSHWTNPLPSGETFESVANSVNDYAVVTDPTTSTQNLAFTSWLENPLLVYACYWHRLITGKYDFENNPVIMGITKERVYQTERNTWGLVRYVTGGQPVMVTITPSSGAHGKISPSTPVNLAYNGDVTFTFSPDSGYVVDQVLLDNVPQKPEISYSFTQATTDHTITATFKPESSPEGIIPLCQAGTPFDSSKYPQNTLYSDPMEFKCSWDGTGRVFISGDKSSLTGVYADDGFTITIQPAGVPFDAQPHSACQHKILELTSGMTPGLNSFTLIVQNWRKLSMSYGSITGYGTDQMPYIVQVNYPSDTALTSQGSIDQTPFIENESEKEG